MDTDRLERGLGWRPRPASPADRAQCYLVWREGLEEQALTGRPPDDRTREGTR